MKKFLAFFLLAFVLITPVFAQYGLEETAGAANLTGGPTDPTEIVGKVIGAGLSLIGIVFFILTLYAGIVWMVARGNEDSAKKAIDTIIAASIGMIITMSAYAITSFILDAANQSALGGGSAPSVTDVSGDSRCTALNGTCGTPESCTPSVGTVQSGLCSGGTDNVCCVPPAATP